MNRVHSANITLNAAENESVNAASGILASLFPEKEYIKTNYPYSRNYPFYCQWHIYTGYLNTLTHRNTDAVNTGEKESAQIGMERVKLLEKYKIVEK